jgi:hypothetical protein
MKVIALLTRRIFLASLLLASLPKLSRAQNADGTQLEVLLMKIRITFHGQDFTATLYDNASAREFASLLPLDLTISDFADNEKIAYLPHKLENLSRGPFANAAPGDLCYYVPWGNLAFFHAGYESTRDLVRLGRLDSDVKPLLTRGEFPLRIQQL